MLSTTVKNINRRPVPLYNALQDFGTSGLVKKAHYLGNITVAIENQINALRQRLVIERSKTQNQSTIKTQQEKYLKMITEM